MKRYLGLNLYIKIENPRGLRIQRLFADGRSLDRAQCYQVTSHTAQSVPTKFGTNRRELSVDAIEALRLHLSKRRQISIDSRSTVVAV